MVALQYSITFWNIQVRKQLVRLFLKIIYAPVPFDLNPNLNWIFDSFKGLDSRLWDPETARRCQLYLIDLSPWMLTVSGYQGLSAILWQPTQPDCYVSKLSVTVIPFVVARELLICAKCWILAQGPGSTQASCSFFFSPLPVRGGACGRGESHAGRCCTPRLQGLCSCLSPVSLRWLAIIAS